MCFSSPKLLNLATDLVVLLQNLLCRISYAPINVSQENWRPTYNNSTFTYELPTWQCLPAENFFEKKTLG